VGQTPQHFRPFAAATWPSGWAAGALTGSWEDLGKILLCFGQLGGLTAPVAAGITNGSHQILSMAGLDPAIQSNRLDTFL
jgi:hypothetical protein